MTVVGVIAVNEIHRRWMKFALRMKSALQMKYARAGEYKRKGFGFPKPFLLTNRDKYIAGVGFDLAGVAFI